MDAKAHTVTPVVIDSTEVTFAKFNNQQVIRTADGDVFALCPILGEPLPDGQFSYAPQIQRAVNLHDDLVAAARARAALARARGDQP